MWVGSTGANPLLSALMAGIAPPPTAVADTSQPMDVAQAVGGRHVYDESKEEDVLQESKEQEPEGRVTTAPVSLNAEAPVVLSRGTSATSGSEGNSPLPALVQDNNVEEARGTNAEPSDDEADWEDVDDDEDEAEQMDVEMPDDEADANADEDEDDQHEADDEGGHSEDESVEGEEHENVQFVNSLPADLRREVLEAATEEFLQTLTPAMRQEAAHYHADASLIERAILQSQQTAPAPAPAPAPSVSSGDTRSIVIAPSIVVPSAPSAQQVSVQIATVPSQPSGLDALAVLYHAAHSASSAQQHNQLVLETPPLPPTLPTLDLSMANVVGGEDALPFNGMFISKLFALLAHEAASGAVGGMGGKLPKHLSRLILQLCHTPALRHVVRVWLAALARQRDGLRKALEQMFREIDRHVHPSLHVYHSTVINEQIDGLVQHFCVGKEGSVSSVVDVGALRCLMRLGASLLKKSRHLVFHELMKFAIRNTVVKEALTVGEMATSGDEWIFPVDHPIYSLYGVQTDPAGGWTSLFASLLAHLRQVVGKLHVEDLELCLLVVEEATSAWSKLSVAQVNALCAQLLSNPRPTISEEDQGETMPSSESNSSTAPMVFAILSTDTMSFFPQVVALTQIPASRKRVMRIMRHLALFNNNWHLLLIQCVHSANALIPRCVDAARRCEARLRSCCEGNSADAVTAGVLREICEDADAAFAQLLNVLKLMLVLRARSTPQAATESLCIAHYMLYIGTPRLFILLAIDV